ncbi:hypothetical protein NUM3379_35060 [Kineococcus sp. NUM-3379]
MASKTGLGNGAAVQAAARRKVDTKATGEDGTTPAPRVPQDGIVAALRRNGVAQGGGGAQVVRLDDIAEHPDNPRDDLGDLAELADSIRDFGVLQAIILVPAEAFLQEHPQHREAVAGRSWVVIAGHRRRAASLEAGKEEIPAVIRPDLAGRESSAITFVVENYHRRDLAPMEEARAFATLVDLGLSQREVARRTGVSQSHVSKRLTLLTLPQPVQDALGEDKVDLKEALALAQAPEEHRLEVWELAQQRQWPVASAVTAVMREVEAKDAEEKAKQEAEAAGIPVVEAPFNTWGSKATDHRCYAEKDIEAAREAGTLVATPTSHGLTFYSTEPVRESSSRPGDRRAEDEQARRQANKARLEACARLVQTRPSTKQLAADLAVTVFHGHVGTADAMKRAHKWLGERVGAASAGEDSTQTIDVYAWHRSITDPAEQAWVAWAMAVASDESHAAGEWGGWGQREAAHLQRLIQRVGYAPTPWEQKRLAAATAAAGSAGAGENSQSSPLTEHDVPLFGEDGDTSDARNETEEQA